ncbi:MAG: hypothetical protein GC129_06750 [Proteobacteria bacterium]|nr:hypothetical protein [Pseudomonadota bacterium]
MAELSLPSGAGALHYQGSVLRSHLHPGSGGLLFMCDCGPQGVPMVSIGDKERYFPVPPEVAEARTAQNTAVMEFLCRHGHPVAFVSQSTPTSFITQWVEMLKLEIVVRFVALGSSCKTHGWEEGMPVGGQVDLYYKGYLDMRDPANPKLGDTHSLKLGQGETPEGVYTDPLVQRFVDRDPGPKWWFFDPKKRAVPGSQLCILPAPIPVLDVWQAQSMVAKASSDLALAFRGLDLRPLKLGYDWGQLGDVKMEVGWLRSLAVEKSMVIADVVNQDSLRLLPEGNWRDKMAWVSKEPLRIRARAGDSDEALAELALRSYVPGARVFGLLNEAA